VWLSAELGQSPPLLARKGVGLNALVDTVTSEIRSQRREGKAQAICEESHHSLARRWTDRGRRWARARERSRPHRAGESSAHDGVSS
jgi:hypothetical protein